MNSNDHRIRHEGLDRSTAVGAGAYSSVQTHLGSAPGKQTTSVATSVQLTPNARIFPVHLSREPPVRVHFARSWLSGRQVLVSDRSPHPRSSYTASLGSGKTSFLRLLLDTSDISPTVAKDQLTSVAKFVQGCSGHTSHIRTASIDINLDVEGNGGRQCLGLTLIDTPSLDFQDEATSERLLAENIRLIDNRFTEGLEDVSAHIIFPCYH
jgi:hypothetical protein